MTKNDAVERAIASCDAWEPQARLIGNTTAKELGDMLRELQALQTSRPDAGKENDGRDYPSRFLMLRGLWDDYSSWRNGGALKSGKCLCTDPDTVIMHRETWDALKSEDRGRWMPIESAPRDGRRIIVRGSYPVASVGFWEAPKDRWNVFQANWVPTHWQFLPPTSEGV